MVPSHQARRSRERGCVDSDTPGKKTLLELGNQLEIGSDTFPLATSGRQAVMGPVDAVVSAALRFVYRAHRCVLFKCTRSQHPIFGS